jgi:hypothetical protein
MVIQLRWRYSSPTPRGRFNYPDGRSEDITARAGQVMYMDAVVHDPENLGDKPFEVLAIELKV